MSDTENSTEVPPASRGQTKRRWVWAAGVSSLLVILLALAIPNGAWDGFAQRTIHIRVTDNSTGYPVGGATVTLMQAQEEYFSEHLDSTALTSMLQELHHLATTNEQGEAEVTGQFGAGGGNLLLWQFGVFIANGKLSISHPKYGPTEGLLQNYLQRKEFPLRTKKIDVHIYLVPI